jgi:peptidoglycan hydrolase CwlO-like protein
MEILYLCLLLASVVCVYVNIRNLWERFYDATDELQDQDVTNFEALGELDAKIRNETNDLDDKIEALQKELDELKRKVEEIPVEQLQSVYDSEKQFQDGLSAIMNYFGPRGENDR